jgi:hypothetical protein
VNILNFFSGLEIPVLLHFFVLLWLSQSTYERYIILRDEMDGSESLVVFFRELFRNMQRTGLRGNMKGPNLDTLPRTYPVSDIGISSCSYSSTVGTKTYVQNIIAGLSSFITSDTKAWKSEFLHSLSKEKPLFWNRVLLWSILGCYFPFLIVLVGGIFVEHFRFLKSKEETAAREWKGTKRGLGGGGYAFHSAVHFSCVTLN